MVYANLIMSWLTRNATSPPAVSLWARCPYSCASTARKGFWIETGKQPETHHEGTSSQALAAVPIAAAFVNRHLGSGSKANCIEWPGCQLFRAFAGQTPEFRCFFWTQAAARLLGTHPNKEGVDHLVDRHDCPNHTLRYGVPCSLEQRESLGSPQTRISPQASELYCANVP
jgi:hypothetical protein